MVNAPLRRLARTPIRDAMPLLIRASPLHVGCPLAHGALPRRYSQEAWFMPMSGERKALHAIRRVPLRPLVVLLLLATTQAQVQLLDLKVLNGARPGARERARELRDPGRRSRRSSTTWTGSRSSTRPTRPSPRQFKVLTRWGGDRERHHQADPLGARLVQRERARERRTATYYVAIGAPPGSGELYAVGPDEPHRGPHGPEHLVPHLQVAVPPLRRRGRERRPARQPGPPRPHRRTGGPVTPAITETVLEEYAGYQSVRCVVRQRGQLGQLRFTCRWFFYSGR